MSRAQIEMIGVGENDFGAQLFERLLPKSLNARSGADGKKKGRLNHAVRRGQPAASRAGGIGLGNFKGKVHSASVARCALDSGHANSTDHIKQPEPEDNRESGTRLNFLGSRRGKSDRHQRQRPNPEEFHGLPQHSEPVR